MRGHAAGGGFYWHYEASSNGTYPASLHWPGFSTGVRNGVSDPMFNNIVNVMFNNINYMIKHIIKYIISSIPVSLSTGVCQIVRPRF